MTNLISMVLRLVLWAFFGLAMIAMLLVAAIINIPVMLITALTDKHHFQHLAEIYRSSFKHD